MSAEHMRGDGSSSLRMEGEMSIYRAAELKQVLLEAIAQTPVLELDLSAVTELDTAGVQLLLMARQAAEAAQCELRLTNHSPAVTDVLDMLNLGGQLGDPLVVLPRASSHQPARGSHES